VRLHEGSLRTSSLPKLNLLFLLRASVWGFVENQYSTDFEYHPAPPRVYTRMSIHTEGKLCSDLVECLVSMPLLAGEYTQLWVNNVVSRFPLSEVRSATGTTGRCLHSHAFRLDMGPFCWNAGCILRSFATQH